jgi:hypothetical protein
LPFSLIAAVAWTWQHVNLGAVGWIG